METIYFVLPAYNEEANIEDVIAQWHPICEQINAEGNKAHLVIANDGSKDKTFAIMQSLQSKYPLLKPLDKPNSGHGATVLYLYRYAIEDSKKSGLSTFDFERSGLSTTFIFQTDSDGQTLPEEFWQMWNNRHNYDFQIGTRGGRQDGANRVFVTKTLRLVVWLMFHVWVKDANTPFRLLKVDKLIPILDVIPQDYNLANVAVSAIAVRWHYNIGWYPITFRPRQGGVNSINMKRIFKIGIKALTDFRTINKNLK
ncbi:MAG: glycosyltransferase family 2 protein [Paludibacteraceae bacterium]|nr:glycosyltransferase family 2 protein [Paludibacteraceae bacterium]